MKKLLSLCLSLALLFSATSVSFVSASSVDAQDCSGSIVTEDKTFFYKAPDRSEYQLTQEQLDAPTDALIEYILDYPYLVDLYTSNISTIDAYISLRESFNGLAELETREDAASKLVCKFVDLVDSTANDSQIAAVFLHTILSIPSYCNDLSETEAATYSQISEYWEFVDDTALAQSAVGTSAGTSVAFTVNGFSYTRSSTDGSTTSGTTVPLYTALSDFSNDEKASVATATAAAYGIEKLGNATSMYNCHSYAWHQSSTSNVSWIRYVSPYINDDHCALLSNASVGSIAVYYNSNGVAVHSAVVTSVDGDTVVCKSKWGADGLFEHEIGNVPLGYRYNSTIVLVKFFKYTRSHSCTVTIDNAATHTRTCTVCGWTSTEAHVENVKTGKCITCGLQGPFMAYLNTVPASPDDEHTCLNE